MSWVKEKTASIAGGPDARRAPSEEKNDLVFYLVTRFILVLVAVFAAESALAWLESVSLLDALRALTESTEAPQSLETTSAVAVIQWAWSMLQSAGSTSAFPAFGLARQSAALFITVAMILLLVAPLVAGAIVFSRMVVKKVRALQERREREIARNDAQRSQFITDVAHDLRTPLMAISGMAHALSDGVVRDEGMREEYLRSICEKSDKMSGLVNSVFDYTKLNGGAFELQKERIDLPQTLLREAAAAYTDAEEAGMTLTTFIPEDPCTVIADPVQIARVVSNLIANAVKHNGAGAEVSVLLVRQAAVAFVVVADTGAPITGDPEALFQPFTQGDTARSGSGGSGLGLSICKRIADMHGFDLAIAQPYGRFTKAFYLRCTVEQ
ncbi:MAG: HAMP domain-containing histidine kinase [Coriobacteriaceae bacterium]|nr:HAMP domain-containing histidine kinase [Coriobacteriaceae bacterium]